MFRGLHFLKRPEIAHPFTLNDWAKLRTKQRRLQKFLEFLKDNFMNFFTQD